MPRPRDSPGLPSGSWLRKLRHEAEGSIGALRDELELDSRGTSQHLAAFRSQGHVASHKEGTSGYYRVGDARTFETLELAKENISWSIEGNTVILADLAEEAFGPRRDRG